MSAKKEAGVIQFVGRKDAFNDRGKESNEKENEDRAEGGRPPGELNSAQKTRVCCCFGDPKGSIYTRVNNGGHDVPTAQEPDPESSELLMRQASPTADWHMVPVLSQVLIIPMY